MGGASPVTSFTAIIPAHHEARFPGHVVRLGGRGGGEGREVIVESPGGRRAKEARREREGWRDREGEGGGEGNTDGGMGRREKGVRE